MTTPQQLLKQELKAAERELKQVEGQLEERPEFGLGTGSTGSFTWEMALARRERLQEQIEALHAALQRVAEGTYGICQNCGAAIDPERLEIVPTATVCPACARKSPGHP